MNNHQRTDAKLASPGESSTVEFKKPTAELRRASETPMRLETKSHARYLMRTRWK
jgi:hypothetical protein